MTAYDECYYILQRPHGDDQVCAVADQKTANRGYHYRQLQAGESPLFFENGYRDKDKNAWPVTNMLVTGPGFLVTNAIREKLKFLNIDNMQIYPAVYIDDADTWHENYWFVGFYEELDCWDRQRSTVDIDEDDDEDDDVDVDKYCLDAGVLDAIAEENRLMFKMGGSSMNYIFVHQRIIDLFNECNMDGARFFKVSDFKEGDQFRP